MKSRKRLGIILAVLGAIVAIGIGAYVYMTAEQANELAKQNPTVEVVMALIELPERVPVPASAVAITKVPAGIAATEAATDITKVVGKYPLTKIYKNEVVIQSKLAESVAQAGPTFSLKPGMVAYTYAGADLLNATGAIRVGDRVDMLLSLNLPKPVPATGTTSTTGATGAQGGSATAPVTLPPVVAQTFMQNLDVMHIGSFPGAAGEASGGKQITFQVSHQDALILKWAKDAGGVIDLVLRHPSDKEPVDTEAITGNYIFKKFKFQLAEPIQ